MLPVNCQYVSLVRFNFSIARQALRRRTLSASSRRFTSVAMLAIPAALLIPFASNAQVSAMGDKPFVWIQLVSPAANSHVDAIGAMNGNGDVAGTLYYSDTGLDRPFVFIASKDKWYVLPGLSSIGIVISDINEDRTVVGWTGAGVSATGRKWVYNAQTDSFGFPTSLSQVEVTGVDNAGDLIGNDSSTGQSSAWTVGGSGWFTLNNLPGGTQAKAYGLNEVSGSPDVCGWANDPQGNGVLNAVVWPSTSTTPTALLNGSSHPGDQTAYRINNSRTVLGTIGAASQAVWIYDLPNGVWPNPPYSAGGANRGDINNADEIVIDDQFYYVVRAQNPPGLQQRSIDDLVCVPAGVDSNTKVFTAINDNGWIAGTVHLTNGQTHDNIGVLLIPRDDNNNGIPDYRDIRNPNPYAPDLNDDWVLDWSQPPRMRVGLQGVSNDPELMDVQNMQIIRVIRDQNDIHNVVNNINGACNSQATFINNWSNAGSMSEPQREIVLTIKSAWPSSPQDTDYLPPVNDNGSELGQTTILSEEQAFAYQSARCIDYIQIGNEIWTGNGRYHLDDVSCSDCSGSTYTGYVSMAQSCLPCALRPVFDWIGAQVDAVRRGSALAGRPLRIIGPAGQLGTVLAGRDGDAHGQYGGSIAELEDPNAAAYFLEQLILFCNNRCIPVDMHYHFWDYGGQFLEGVRDLDDTMYRNVDWPAVDQHVCLEFGPLPSEPNQTGGDWWIHAVGQENTQRFFDSLPGNLPLGNTTWAQWQTAWDSQEDTIGSRHYPTDFVGSVMGILRADPHNYHIAVYADGGQAGGQYAAVPFDMGGIWATKLKNEGENPGFTRWRERYESGAMNFVLSGFFPHPNVCQMCGQ